MCGGSCDVTKETYKYSGVEDCTVMPFVPNGGAKTVHMDVWDMAHV